MTKTKKDKKVFVLDTSVILFDHYAVKNFKEHDVAIPITVLEELDNFKKGNEIKNFEAREFIRFLDGLSENYTLQDWIPIDGHNKGKLKVIMNTHGTDTVDAEEVFADRKNDHKILNAALYLETERKDAKVVLVTKDINLRLKAKALNLPAEDYSTGKIKDVDSLYTGRTTMEDIPSEIVNEVYEKGFSGIEVIPKELLIDNHYFILKSDKNSVLVHYNPIEKRLDHVEKSDSCPNGRYGKGDWKENR